MRENMIFFLEWLHSLSMVVSGYTHFPAHDTFSFFYVTVRTLRIPSIDKTARLVSFLNCCEQSTVNRDVQISVCCVDLSLVVNTQKW